MNKDTQHQEGLVHTHDGHTHAHGDVQLPGEKWATHTHEPGVEHYHNEVNDYLLLSKHRVQRCLKLFYVWNNWAVIRSLIVSINNNHNVPSGLLVYVAAFVTWDLVKLPLKAHAVSAGPMRTLSWLVM